MLDGRRSGRVHAAVTARRVLVKREQGIVVWNSKTGRLLSVTVCAVKMRSNDPAAATSRIDTIGLR